MPLRISILVLTVLLVSICGCRRSGRLSAPDAKADVASPGDLVESDTASPEQISEDTPLSPSGPTIVEVIRLPLADYGPAFWMEAEVGDDGLLEVIVRARDLTSLVGFAAQVTWNPELLELIEVAATAPIGGVDAVARGVGAGLEPGRLTLGVTRFPKEVDPWNPQASGADLPGSVEMGHFVLRPLASGDTVLRFREGHRTARRPDYAEISCAWAGMQVRIIDDDSGSEEVAR